MASQASDFNTFGTAARAGSIGGTEVWSTESNAQTDNGVRAEYNTSGVIFPWANGYTFYLTAESLTTEVPAGATVDGIEIKIQRRKSIVATAAWADSVVYIIKGGTIQTAENKAVVTAYTDADAEVTYGGPTDKWGQTWTDTEINASDFGVAISCAISGDDEESHAVAQIDYIHAVVYYTGGAGTARKKYYVIS